MLLGVAYATGWHAVTVAAGSLVQAMLTNNSAELGLAVQPVFDWLFKQK